MYNLKKIWKEYYFNQKKKNIQTDELYAFVLSTSNVLKWEYGIAKLPLFVVSFHVKREMI